MVTNKLAPKKTNATGVTFEVDGMEVKLTPQIVKNYLVSGNSEKVTDQELAMFINLCKFSGLNPWVREAYCIKYGNAPATMVVGKEAYMKRADDNPNFDGIRSGIVVVNNEGVIEYRVGKLKLAGEELVGGWAEVWRKDKTHSYRTEVSFDEYVGKKSDGTVNGQWSSKPATMIEKVAVVQALRTAFPKSFKGLYVAEEMGIDESSLSDQPVEQPTDAEIVDAEIKEVKEVKEQKQTITDDVAAALFGK